MIRFVVPSVHSFAAMALVLIPLGAGRALTLPTLATLISHRTPREEQGGMLGLAQSLNAGARAIGPLVAGWLYDFGPARPFVLAGVLSALAALSLFGLRNTTTD